jgi:hypothetical protein
MKIMLCLLEDVFIKHWKHAAKGKKANLSIGFSPHQNTAHMLFRELLAFPKPFSAIKAWLLLRSI